MTSTRTDSPGGSAFFRALLAGATAAVLFPAVAASQVRFFGPLTFEEQASLQRISYTHQIEAADLVPRGRVETVFTMGYANIFQRDSTASLMMALDLERLVSTMGVRWGLTDRLEMGARLSWETSGGGILDGFISGWHQVLHLPDNDRNLYANGLYAQWLEGPRGLILLDVPRRTMALGDVRVSAKWLAVASKDDRKVLSLRAVARVPTQSNLVGAQRSDVALMMLLRRSWERWHLHGTFGASTVRAARDYDGMFRSSSWFGDVALERNLAPWISGLVQYTVATPRARGFHRSSVDAWPCNLIFGVAGSRGPWRWDVSFQEDVPPNSPAVDFTLGLGIRRTW